MRVIAIVDTSYSTNNVGDEIIMDSVNSIINSYFSDSYIYRISSHDLLSETGMTRIRQSDICFLGGTNLISPNVSTDSLWRVGVDDISVFEETNTVSIGVGWNDYTENPSKESRNHLKRIFSKKFHSSVRDGYTERQFKECGIETLMTSCPTTWGLTRNFCKTIPTKKSSSVVFTLTSWRKNIKLDQELVQTLKRVYKNIYFFSQMREDLSYLESLGESGIRLVSPTLSGFDRFLDNEDVDYVGTRLHGGIRALQKRKRSLIISVDNRATEIAKNINLPVIERKDIGVEVEKWCEDSFITKINVPYQNITNFIKQFPISVNPNAFSYDFI